LILSKALKAQKEAEDKSCQIAPRKLRSEVITVRNEALDKDKRLFSLVDRLKTSEAKLSAQVEAHKAEVEELKKKLAETSKKFEVAMVKHEISEIERLRVQKNVEELRESKERCYEISLECAKNSKEQFCKGKSIFFQANIHPQ
jgi:predicted RNase H-like nuclease (RuvC/YqgF family)